MRYLTGAYLRLAAQNYYVGDVKTYTEQAINYIKSSKKTIETINAFILYY